MGVLQNLQEFRVSCGIFAKLTKVLNACKYVSPVPVRDTRTSVFQNESGTGYIYPAISLFPGTQRKAGYGCAMLYPCAKPRHPRPHSSSSKQRSKGIDHTLDNNRQ